jgi:NADPH:quinone reductase-like Zn-dependent oxidoreductase
METVEKVSRLDHLQTFPAVVTDFKKTYLTELEPREPNENEVMVKVMSAPVNPSDNYFIIGQYGNPK